MPAPKDPMPALCGGIDLGGTKIEAQLFSGPELSLRHRLRVDTPQTSFEALLKALSAQIAWLCEAAGDRTLPIGIAAPGIADPKSGLWRAANLPLAGRDLAKEIAQRAGRHVVLVNDAMAFTRSEARDDARVVVGIVLGTGIGAGVLIDGRFPPRHNGLAVEVGHLGLPAATMLRHGLPLLPCGCGRMGCFELYASGTGIANLAEWRLGRPVGAAELLASNEPQKAEIIEIWADIAGACLAAVELMLAPECVVLGGGLSGMPDFIGHLQSGFQKNRVGDQAPPRLELARHRDVSGARGAALAAMEARNCL